MKKKMIFRSLKNSLKAHTSGVDGLFYFYFVEMFWCLLPVCARSHNADDYFSFDVSFLFTMLLLLLLLLSNSIRHTEKPNKYFN